MTDLDVEDFLSDKFGVRFAENATSKPARDVFIAFAPNRIEGATDFSLIVTSSLALQDTSPVPNKTYLLRRLIEINNR